MNSKDIMKTAKERIIKLSTENETLSKEKAQLAKDNAALTEKVASYEREKKVDQILDVLIDEKKYFPASQRNEKKAYLMKPETDIESFMKMAGELSPREPGMFFESGEEVSNGTIEDSFFTTMINKLAGGLG